jgi:arsenate reductase
MKNVLFVCPGNSARGLLAEAMLSLRGADAFCGYSAGAHPGGLINPLAAELIQDLGYPLEKLRCKRWDEFATEDAPPLDFVILLCVKVRSLQQPAWAGTPLVVQWEIEDPTVSTGTIEEKRRVFRRAYEQLNAHIDLFLKLPHDQLDRGELHEQLNGFGAMLRPAAEQGLSIVSASPSPCLPPDLLRAKK